MKRLLLTFGLAAALLGKSYAVEYVTITSQNRVVSLNPADLVEVVGLTNGGVGAAYVDLTFQGDSGPQSGDVREGTQFVGLSQMYLATGKAVTLKITKASEITKVGPTSVLILPEGSAGDYNIVVESSADLNSWQPFHSQTVSAADAQRYFRTRIVKTQ